MVYKVDSCVHGLQVYQDAWIAVVDDDLHWKRNIHDSYAVAYKRLINKNVQGNGEFYFDEWKDLPN